MGPSFARAVVSTKGGSSPASRSNPAGQCIPAGNFDTGEAVFDVCGVQDARLSAR